MTKAQQSWRERNREYLKAGKAKWYQEHKALQDQRNKDWIAAHPEERQKHVQQYYDTHDFQHRLSCARAKAKQRGYVFAVSIVEVRAADKRQGNRCAICGSEETGRCKKLSIDHCHRTGGFRGLLCGACNLMLGKAGDDPLRLRMGAQYLESGVSGYDF